MKLDVRTLKEETRSLKRLYIYEDDYNNIMAFAKKYDLKIESPNRRNNFPFFFNRFKIVLERGQK